MASKDETYKAVERELRSMVGEDFERIREQAIYVWNWVRETPEGLQLATEIEASGLDNNPLVIRLLALALDVFHRKVREKEEVRAAALERLRQAAYLL